MQNLYVLLRQFDVIGGVERTGQAAFCLLMALWRRSNELGWKSNFTMSNTELKYKGGFSSDKTLIGARGKLMEQGFIKYAKSNKTGKCGIYILNFDLLSLSGLHGSGDEEYYLEEEEDLSEAPWENCGEDEEHSPRGLPDYEPDHLPDYEPECLPKHIPDDLPEHAPEYLPNYLPKDDKKVNINILDYTRLEKTITDNNNNTDSNNSNNSHNTKEHEDEVFIKTMEHYCKRANKIETSLKAKERQAMYEICKKMPLEVILKGIDMSFDNFKHSGESERINSFIYCEKVINTLWNNNEQGLKGERANGKSKGCFAGGENGEIKIHSSGIGLSL